MSRGGVPIRRFFTSPAVQTSSRLETGHIPVLFTPKQVEHRARVQGHRWMTYAQTDLTLPSKHFKTLVLGLSVTMARGLVFVSLTQDLKMKRCSLHDGVITESVDDVIVTIFNNSDDEVLIKAGDIICSLTVGAVP